jgi:putative peptidoglycan lipid II flippase
VAEPEGAAPESDRVGRGPLLVATGIFLSRIAGLVRSRFQAGALGLQSEAADAFALALRLPNFLQNLLGEGVLSASFIPPYTSLMAKGEGERADNLAGAVFTALCLVVSILVLGGVLLAPMLVSIFASAKSDEVKQLATTLVRIMFPGTGVLVLSAWCLAVLNSHRRFLLSYSAPIAWNIAIIVFFILGSTRSEVAGEIALWAAAGAVLGSVLQFLVQLPSVLTLVRGLRLGLAKAGADLRGVARSFVPAVTARGSVQLGGYIDTYLVSRIPDLGSVAALGYAQMLYQLPISLFGMAISAAELPEISSVAGGAVERESPRAAELRKRLGRAGRRTLFLVLPSAVALALLGDHIVALLFMSGLFGAEDVVSTWIVLAGFSLGVVPATMGRLSATSFFAMHDTRTPLAFALIRITLSAVLAVGFLFFLPRIMAPELFAEHPLWRVAGLSLGGSIAFWMEYALLHSALEARIGPAESRRGYTPRLLAATLVAGVAGLAARLLLDPAPGWPGSLVPLAAFGATYLAAAALLGIADSAALRAVLKRNPGNRRGSG